LIGLDRGPRQRQLVRIEFFRGAAEVAFEQGLQLRLRRVALQRRVLKQHLRGVALPLGDDVRHALGHEQRSQLGGGGGQDVTHVSL